MKTIVLIFLIGGFVLKGHAQENWKIAKSADGINVYVRSVSGSEYYAFKATMLVRTTQNEIVKVFKNVGKYHEWFAYTASVRLIKQTANRQTFSMEIDYPWPYANECMNYDMTFLALKDGVRKITIKGSNKNVSCTHPLKKAEGYVLLKSYKAYTRITYVFHSEPSQNIPTWLINPMIHEMPYQTFVALKKQLKT